MVRQYLELEVALGERDPDSLDFVIGVNHDLDHAKSDLENLDSIRAGAISLSAQLRDMPISASFDASRKSFLLRQLSAMILRTQQLAGINRTFDEESQTLFGVVAPSDYDGVARQRIRRHIAQLLPPGLPPAQAYTRYDSRFVVPPNRVPAVMNAALDQCRALTLQHMSLPADEHIDVRYVFNKPWSAFSRYLGDDRSRIEVNMDYPLTVDRILNLACHEGYPGHHVLNSIRERTLVEQRHLDEFRVQPTFSPQSFVTEAAASYAPSMVLSTGERIRIERGILFPLAGISGQDVQRYIEVEDLVASLHTAEPSIARDYLDGRLEWARAVDALARETLMEHGETELLYLNEYRSYMLSYTLGYDMMQAFIEAGHPTDAERWQRYQSLMSNPVVSLPHPGDTIPAQ